MSKSPFRPSDDAATYLFPIAANAMAAVSLHDLASMLSSLKVAPKLADKAQKLSEEIRQAIYSHGVVNHPKYGKIFAYEVDGFTNAHLIDDANVPSLLSLPYLGFCSPSDPVYLNTRRFVLSSDNPYYSVSTVDLCQEVLEVRTLDEASFGPCLLLSRALQALMIER